MVKTMNTEMVQGSVSIIIGIIVLGLILISKNNLSEMIYYILLGGISQFEMSGIKKIKNAIKKKHK